MRELSCLTLRLESRFVRLKFDRSARCPAETGSVGKTRLLGGGGDLRSKRGPTLGSSLELQTAILVSPR